MRSDDDRVAESKGHSGEPDDPLPNNRWQFLAWVLKRPPRTVGLIAVVCSLEVGSRVTWGPVVATLMRHLP